MKSPEISVAEVQKNESKTLRFLPGLNDEHQELQKKLAEMQKSISESEQKVRETEWKIGAKNGEAMQANAQLSEKNNRINAIDTQVGQKQDVMKKNTGEIGSIDTKIAELKKNLGGGDTPETFEAVIWPDNQTSASKESSADIQQQISALERQKAKLIAHNAMLKKEIEALKPERELLVAQRDKLEQVTLPQLQNEIAQLVELKKSQEKEKNDLVLDKDSTEAKNSTLMAEIQTQEQEIAGVQVSIAQSQTVYAENSARESHERPKKDFFESFTGVWA